MIVADALSRAVKINTIKRNISEHNKKQVMNAHIDANHRKEIKMNTLIAKLNVNKNDIKK